MGRHQSLAIIIPAYNEAGSISNIVKKLMEIGTVIVVNDCSSDQTSQVARNAGAIVLDHEKNKGYEGALRTGFDYSHRENYHYYVTCDADGQHRIEDLQKVVNSLVNENQDLVIGERGSHARIAESIFAFYTKMKYGISDPLSGLKGYSKKGYETLGTFSEFDSIGTQLSLVIVRKGLPYKLVPIDVQKREFGQSRFGSFIKPNIKILKALAKNLFVTA